MTKETQDLLSFAAGDGVQLDIIDAMKLSPKHAKEARKLLGKAGTK